MNIIKVLKQETVGQTLLDFWLKVDCTENIVNIVHITKKGAHLNTSGKYYIHNETKNDNQINDKIEFWIFFI
jgi:hypothetical protein